MTQKISFSRNGFREIYRHLFPPTNDPKFISVYLFIITVIGIILRLYIINRPIAYDEAYTFINFSSKSFKFILADYHAPNNHILNSLLVGIAYRLLGPHNWIVRVPAFIVSVLGIPAAYFAGRRFFTSAQALAAAGILAVVPVFVSEAANGRGYPFIILFSILLAGFGGLIVKDQRKPILIAYAITGALGFYSIPIFLYPMAGISLWVLVTLLTTAEPWKQRWKSTQMFLMACLISGLLTFFLYFPVILFGTGFRSIVANDIVQSETWAVFIENLRVRSGLTWHSWTFLVTPIYIYLSVGSLIVSLLFYKKVSNQRWPMQVFLVLGAGIMITLQRVAPLERIWGYLEMFALIYASAGLIWLIAIVLRPFINENKSEMVLSTLILLVVCTAFINKTIIRQSPEAMADRTVSPEQLAAEFIAEHITENDTIIAPSPIDLQTAYYLKILGVSYDRFQQRGVPLDKPNALIILRSRSDGKIKTMDALLEAFKLEDALNMDAGQLVFEYGPLTIQSIPAR